MRALRRCFPIPLLLLLAAVGLPSATAKGLPEYVVDSVDAQGTSVLEGKLAAINMDGFMGPPPPRLEIVSGTEFGYRRDYQTVDQFTSLGAQPTDPSRSDDMVLPAGRITTAEYRPSANLFLVPLEGAEAPPVQVHTRDSWMMEPSGETTVEQKSTFGGDERDLVTADVAGSLWLADYAGGRDIEVHGSFLAVFYEWDLLVESSGQVLPSGYTYVPTKPLPEQAGVGKGYFNQTYITVRNGTLRLGVEDAHWRGFYLDGMETGIHGTLNLRKAVAIGRSSAPANVSYQGDVRVQVDAGVGQPLTVKMLPSPGAAEVKVETVDAVALDGERGGDLQSTAISPDGGLPAAATVALALLLAASVYVLLLWRSRARYQALMELMEAGRYSEFLRRSPSALRSRRYGARLAVMHAVALLKTGAQRKVLAFLEALKPASKPAPATEAYLQACALAQMGQRKAAAGRLAECLDLDARYAQEVQANPWFNGIRPRRLSGQHVHEFPEGYT